MLCASLSFRIVWSLAGLLNVSRLRELLPFRQAGRAWWEVGLLHMTVYLTADGFKGRSLQMCDAYLGSQGGWHVGHGAHASGELPAGMPDHSQAGAQRHRAHLAQSHEELLRGWPCAQTSLRRGAENKNEGRWRWHCVCWLITEKCTARIVKGPLQLPRLHPDWKSPTVNRQLMPAGDIEKSQRIFHSGWNQWLLPKKT